MHLVISIVAPFRAKHLLKTACGALQYSLLIDLYNLFCMEIAVTWDFMWLGQQEWQRAQRLWCSGPHSLSLVEGMKS